MLLDYRAICKDTDRTKMMCGDGEIDKWFLKKALSEHQSRKHLTTCVRSKDTDEIVGFYSMSTVVEDAKRLPGVKFFPFWTNDSFPCVQLVYLAVNKPLQNKGKGTEILSQLIRSFASMGAVFGIPAMIVTPLNPDATRLYARLGFEPYYRGTRMFLPLRLVLETTEEAEAEMAMESV